MEPQPKIEIGIIGLGAAGCLAGWFAKTENTNVTILEKNEKLGKKIYLTGKGRCNLTNATPVPEFMEAIIRNPKFLYSSFAFFDNFDLMDLFETNGLPLKTERGNRVFPCSDKSSDVNRTLERMLEKKGVSLQKNQEVIRISQNGEGRKFSVEAVSREEKRRHQKMTYFFDRLIIATGGCSYPFTGSTGDGYRFASELGHSCISPVPSLVSISLKDSWMPRVEGLSLRNITLTSKIGKKKLSFFGELVFTRNGISGPVVLKQSAVCNMADPSEISLSIDWKPMVAAHDLYDRMISYRMEHPNQQIKSLMEDFLPKAMVPIFLELLEVEGKEPIHSWKREEQEKFISCLKCFPLKFDHIGGFSEAVVTRGGVSTKEIYSNTLESKKCEELYFAGEVIDVDALTGGYNLQIAFSTGALAGYSAASKERKEKEK